MREIPGWNKVIQKLTGHPGTLAIYHAPGKTHWIDIALSHWQGHRNPCFLLQKHDWGGETYCNIIEEQGQRYVFKLFRLKNIMALRYCHRCGRARKDILQFLRLQEHGFHVPAAMCVLEHRVIGITVSSMLIRAWIEDAQPMPVQLRNILLSSRRRRQLLRSFGNTLAEFHNSGFYHGDLQFRNILCQTNPVSETFFWIDNERGRKFTLLPEKYRVHDLAQLHRFNGNLSNRDRMRIFKAYIIKWPLSRKEKRRFLSAIVRRTQRIAKNRKCARCRKMHNGNRASPNRAF